MSDLDRRTGWLLQVPGCVLGSEQSCWLEQEGIGVSGG
jgi:hypothetical protein